MDYEAATKVDAERLDQDGRRERRSSRFTSGLKNHLSKCYAASSQCRKNAWYKLALQKIVLSYLRQTQSRFSHQHTTQAQKFKNWRTKM